MAEQQEAPELSEELCGNPSCGCNPPVDKDYCSQSCQANATAPDHVCACGHGTCEAE